MLKRWDMNRYGGMKSSVPKEAFSRGGGIIFSRSMYYMLVAYINPYIHPSRYWFPVWHAIVAQFTSHLHVHMERDPSVRGTSPTVNQRSMKLPKIGQRTKASTQGSSQAFVSTDFVPPICCGNMCWSNLIRPLNSFALQEMSEKSMITRAVGTVL